MDVAAPCNSCCVLAHGYACSGLPVHPHLPLQMVSLIRDPANPYDRWAVRVDNVRGQRVGHLPRVLVCHVSAGVCDVNSGA